MTRFLLWITLLLPVGLLAQTDVARPSAPGPRGGLVAYLHHSHARAQAVRAVLRLRLAENPTPEAWQLARQYELLRAESQAILTELIADRKRRRSLSLIRYVDYHFRNAHILLVGHYPPEAGNRVTYLLERLTALEEDLAQLEGAAWNQAAGAPVAAAQQLSAPPPAAFVPVSRYRLGRWRVTFALIEQGRWPPLL